MNGTAKVLLMKKYNKICHLIRQLGKRNKGK